VDIDAFHVPGRDTALAERLGILPGETIVGYISTFSRYEGIRFLIDAVARLRADGRAVRCLLVGDGEERVALEAQASALGIAGQVIFTGRVPHAQVLAYYGLIDIFVIPRTSDRVSQLVTPLKPYEAMATGRPVVFSRVPALAEMVEDGVTGLGFGPEDPGDLASVLGGLLVDMPRRVVLGSAGREWVTRHRTWRENGKRYLELYRSLGAA
jgi:glycosyltransferase involved in cell wall biosynthesis